MDAETKLLPCPFCGGDCLLVVRSPMRAVFVRCRCWGEDSYLPEWVWNRRAKPALDAETRAALEWAIANLKGPAYATDVMTRLRYMAALQALLDGPKVPVPPASAAKIAADLWELIRATGMTDHTKDRYSAIAARVEALGLQPSEREMVRIGLRRVRDTQRLMGMKAWLQAQEYGQRAIAALSPIAERRP